MRALTEGERELIEDALKASAFKYRHAFVNAAARTSEKMMLNIDSDSDGFAKLTATEKEFSDKATAFDNLARMFRRYNVTVETLAEIPEQG